MFFHQIVPDGVLLDFMSRYMVAACSGDDQHRVAHGIAPRAERLVVGLFSSGTVTVRQLAMPEADPAMPALNVFSRSSLATLS